MQASRVIVPRVAPESSACKSQTMAVSLRAAPFQLEIDHARRDTAPRAAITRLPQRKPRPVSVELGVMDMGDLA